ncbi:agmatinase [Synechococcus sp. Ace-Pa]|nr:agmatinase [Synechococcus sp. Ace-Pa]
MLGSTAEDPDLLAITCFNPDLPDINQFDPDLIDSDLFETDGAVFMAGRRDPAGCQVGLFGVPYDGTTSFRPGTRFGPAAIREVSSGLETYCPQLDLDLEDLAFADLGAVAIPFGAPEPVVAAVGQATEAVLALGLKPLMLGGEHSISSGAVGAVAARHPDLVLVQLDAHADLRHSWLGSSHSHACAMRRCLEVLPSGQLLQIAIRSGTRAEFAELRHSGRLVGTGPGLSLQPERLQADLVAALAPLRGRPLYLTVDLDWFDPSVLPGTGTPEPGGFLWGHFSGLVDELRHHRLVGADVVELSPLLDPGGNSAVLAAKVVRSLLLLLGRPAQ